MIHKGTKYSRNTHQLACEVQLHHQKLSANKIVFLCAALFLQNAVVTMKTEFEEMSDVRDERLPL